LPFLSFVIKPFLYSPGPEPSKKAKILFNQPGDIPGIPKRNRLYGKGPPPIPPDKSKFEGFFFDI